MHAFYNCAFAAIAPASNFTQRYRPLLPFDKRLDQNVLIAPAGPVVHRVRSQAGMAADGDAGIAQKTAVGGAG